MQQPTRKLVKRRPTPSQSPAREQRLSANRISGDDSAITPLESIEGDSSVSTMPSNGSSGLGKDKKTKWRMSNPFHSKDKERQDANESAGDSAYDSGSRTETTSSGIPSFSGSERPLSERPLSERPLSERPLSEQPATEEQSRPGPQTNIIPPTPPTQEFQPPPAPTQNNPNQGAVSQETYQDARTGNVVTITTTTTTTTVTTTGPGGTTTVQGPNTENGNTSPQPSITNTSGPSPPSPAPPMPHPSHHQDAGRSHEVSSQSSTLPPIPNKSNMRDRVELDSTSPAIEHPNPMASPVSPTSPTRANFSYPSRTPPPGVPRQVQSYGSLSSQAIDQYGDQYSQHQAPARAPRPVQSYGSLSQRPQEHYAGQSNQWQAPPSIPWIAPQGQPQPQPQHIFQTEPNERYSTHSNQHMAEPGAPSNPYPTSSEPPHVPSHSQNKQKPSTFENLKAAAAGIHGASETLRGTLNNSVDKRFAKPGSAVLATNQAAIDRGRAEMETRRFVHSHPPPPPPAEQAHPRYYADASTSDNQRLGSTTTISSENASAAKSGGRLGGLMKKLKEVPLNTQSAPDKPGQLRVVNK